jgi:two-component system chemotaxis sensor kinase CheA
MTEREVTSLIFLPGFSTAGAVTNVSGRGVGMDVVKTNIENIGGSVDVTSTLGAGSTFRIKIPLTLAIIPAVTFECTGERYAIPQAALVELVSLDRDQAKRDVEWISGAPVYRLRGRLLPLVHLSSVLQLDRSTSAGNGEATDSTYVVVLQVDGQQFGLVVDRVLDSEEIVVKPLGRQLKNIDVYSGATITGDGAVALILDVPAIGTRSGVLALQRERAFTEAAADAAVQDETESLLLVGIGDGRRVSIPLEDVTRLEEFPTSSIEHVGGREVIQYRGRILPLLRLSSYLGSYSEVTGPTVRVVVHTAGNRSVGLLVDEILDIAQETITARSDLETVGLRGSAVVQSKVTEMLDVRSAVLSVDPDFYAYPGAQ